MRVNRSLKTATRRAAAIALSAGCAALLAGAAQAAEFQVEMNQSKALHLSQPVSTVMVGNPVVADVTVESATLLYVMGRSYGRTNIVALDQDGKSILNMDVDVVSQNGSAVTLTRGASQYSYNCTPRCERIVNVGDDPEAFKALMEQVAGTVGSSTSAGQGGGSSVGTGGGMNIPQ
tara:strand:+ start:3381 stop:3908 length:528 start_codon:yes stop_codon:yes gene_type:complete